MTWRHISESVRLSYRIGGPIGRALARAAEESAKEAADRALELARAALEVADDDLAEAMYLLNAAGSEALQAVEVGWSWALPKRKGQAA